MTAVAVGAEHEGAAQADAGGLEALVEPARVAEQLRISQQQLTLYVIAGFIAPVRFGVRRLFRRSDVQRLIERAQTEGLPAFSRADVAAMRRAYRLAGKARKSGFARTVDDSDPAAPTAATPRRGPKRIHTAGGALP